MGGRQLRELCLRFTGAQETSPFSAGTSVFKVHGKMFALSALGSDPLSVSVKCEPGLAQELRAARPGAISPGYHLNKRHWNTVLVDGSLPDQMIADMIEDSYDLVVESLPRAARQSLSADAAATGARPGSPA